MSKFLDMDGLGYLVGNYIKPGLTDYIDNTTYKNLLNFNDWANNIQVYNGTKQITGNSIKLTATGNDCYTKYLTSDFPPNVIIPVTSGQTYIMTWDCNDTSELGLGRVYMFGNGSPSYPAAASSIHKYIRYTIPSAVTYLTFRIGVDKAEEGKNTITYSNLMICTEENYKISSAYVPYRNNVASNSEIYNMWESN